MKRSYNPKDVRVLTYRRLKNLSALVLAAAFFAAVHLGLEAKHKSVTYELQYGHFDYLHFVPNGTKAKHFKRDAALTPDKWQEKYPA